MHSTLALAGALAILGGGATASPSPYTPHPVWLQRRAANTVE